MSIDNSLRDTAKKLGEEISIRFGNEEITYNQLNQEVDNIAQGLIDLGVKHKDRVCVILGNSSHFVRVYYAVIRTGSTVITLNPSLKPHEIDYILRDANVKFLVIHQNFLPEVQNIRTTIADLKIIVVDGSGEVNDIPLDKLLGKKSDPVYSVASEEDIATILYTSGTTGNPKGALLSHGNLNFVKQACLKRMDMRQEDNLLCFIPLSHAFSQIANMIIPLSIGANVTILPQFIPDLVLSEIMNRKISYICAVPAMYGALLSVLTQNNHYDISSLRICVSGGAALPLEISKAFSTNYGLDIIEGSGPTEAIACVGVPNANKPGSVGPALEGVQVAIFDENGTVLPPGEVGELCVKGPNVMQGYLNLPEITAQVIQDGWFHTGDLAKIDEDGYVFIIGRIKDLILVGGMNVYPAEVEQCLYQNPKVQDAAVVGVPDKDRGEIPKAFIVLKPSVEAEPNEFIFHCRKFLANYKCPRQVEIIDQLPRNNMGKVDKKLLQ